MAYAAHAAQALRMLSEAAAGAESAAENSAQSQTEAAMSQQTSASSSEAASAPSPPAEAEPSWDTVTLKSFVFLDFKFWMNYATGAVRISVNLMVAIIMFLMFLMIVKLIVWAVKTVMSNPKQPVDPAVRPFVLLSLKALLWIQILPIVIGQIGINIDSMLAVISAVALAVGIALRPMVENFISGMDLAIRKPFKPGEMVDIASVKGFVRSIGATSTVLDQPDGNVVFVPNTKIITGTFVNFSVSGKVRIDVGPFCLPPHADIDYARAQALAAIKDLPMLLTLDPSADDMEQATPQGLEKGLENMGSLVTATSKNLLSGLTNLAEKVSGFDIDGDGTVAGTPGKDAVGTSTSGTSSGATAAADAYANKGLKQVSVGEVSVSVVEPPSKEPKKVPKPKVLVSHVTPYGIYITLRLWVDVASGMGGSAAATVREAVLKRFREHGVALVWEIDMLTGGGKSGNGRGLMRGDDAVMYGPNAGVVGGGDDDELIAAAAAADASSGAF